MMRTKFFLPITLVASFLVLPGCGNKPLTLYVLDEVDITKRALLHPTYDRADAYSFTGAAVLYPATGGHHTLPVGNYLLAGVLDTLQNTGADEITLSNFDSKCDHGKLFFPDLVCNTWLALSFQINGKEKIISAKSEYRDKSVYALRSDSPLSPGGDLANLPPKMNPVTQQVISVVDNVIGDLYKQI